MTIAHTAIRVPARQHAAVVAWYETALAPLGYKKTRSFLDDQVVGFGDMVANSADWWVLSAAASTPGNPAAAAAAGDEDAVIRPTHTAFVAKGQFYPFLQVSPLSFCGFCNPRWSRGREGAAWLMSHGVTTTTDRATVDAFHQAAVAAGGKCNGEPGVRERSGPNYYAAFVLDPAGNNIEAVYNAAV